MFSFNFRTTVFAAHISHDICCGGNVKKLDENDSGLANIHDECTDKIVWGNTKLIIVSLNQCSTQPNNYTITITHYS